MRNIGENEKEKVNLYAVTYHFPKDLFSRFQGTKFLECVRENQIYVFKMLTPVRFIITKGNTHPVLGLFSDDPEQIIASRQRLEQDGWLIRQVSSYLQQLYNHYSLEGVDMPYTQEMFIKDYYPEWYEKIQAAKARGKLIGEILLCQRLLKQAIYSQDELESKAIEELRRISTELEAKLTI